MRRIDDRPLAERIQRDRCPPRAGALALMIAVGAGMPAPALAQDPAIDDLLRLDLEQLAQIRVTSVSRHEESLFESAASVHVITGEDIRMSGATSIPEALRLAPGVEVTRSGARSWSISIRGFNSSPLSNKLLVLIDGRSVYSPLYAGVFWDVQDLLLEDIERIEVVSGPGGTLWGANAVNGVINIITRPARDPVGGFARIGGGSEERMAGVRYGAPIGEHGAFRAYAKTAAHEPATTAAGGSARDDWRMNLGGFRADWQYALDSFTVQGDLYRARKDGLFRDDFTFGTLPGPPRPGRSDLAGANLLGRWSRALDGGAGLSLQAYWDHTERDVPGSYDESRDTFDLDFQHRLLQGRHDLTWGAGLRVSSDEIDSTLFATFLPARRTDRTWSLFVQDRVELRERLYLTVGSKFEHNDYTGFEVQPNLRLAWHASERNLLWAAVSRAVRIPSRLDADLRLTSPLSIPGLAFPLYAIIEGSPEFQSEELLAWEAGYRVQARDNLSLDLALYYNDYDELQTTEPAEPVFVGGPPPDYVLLPNTLSNGMEGLAKGGTLALRWHPLRSWRLQFNYAFVDLDLRNKPGFRDPNAARIAGRSPRHQASLFSFVDLPGNVGLFAGLRHVDELPENRVDAYTALDVGLEWNPTRRLRLGLSGRNLTDSLHQELAATGPGVERSVYAQVDYRF